VSDFMFIRSSSNA